MACLYIPLCFVKVLWSYTSKWHPSDKDFHDMDVDLEGDGVLNIHQDTSIVAYLQANGIPIGLTSKEHD